MNKKYLIISTIAVLALILAWLLFFWTPTSTQSIKHEVLELSAAPVGGDFIVETKDKNKDVELSLKDLRGQVVILYFGYTLCPDICPTSLSLLTQALSQMSEEELSGLKALFVSVDPDRDNTTRLATYAEYFHPSIIGATAEKEEIDRMTKLYGAAYKIVDNGSAAGYLVDHSSYTYIIDKKGKLRHTLAHGALPKEILKAVRELLVEE